MSQHSIAEVKNKLSELVERAEKGEEIVITRHGRAVAALTPVAKQPRPMTEADWDWLAKRRVGRKLKQDAGTLVSRMRDEDWR
jgi:prevent-host-death family protein